MIGVAGTATGARGGYRRPNAPRVQSSPGVDGTLASHLMGTYVRDRAARRSVKHAGGNSVVVAEVTTRR